MAATKDAVDALPPWDASTYFQAPTQTVVTFTGPGNTSKLLIGADPMRVALIFCSSAGPAVQVALFSDPTVTAGFPMSNAKPPVQMIFSEVGPLVQHEWWGNAAGTGSITVIAVSLSKWPKKGDRRFGDAKSTRPANGNSNGR